MKRELIKRLNAVADKIKKDNPSIADKMDEILLDAADIFLDEKSRLHGYEGLIEAISTAARFTEKFKDEWRCYNHFYEYLGERQ